MRISTLVCASFFLVTMATCDSVASDQQVESFSQVAATFLPQAEFPVLFEGRVVEVDSGRMACTVTNSRDFTYSVDTVLFGFVPPGRVKVAYPGCAKSQAPHSYTGAVLVLATFYGHDLWGSRRELVLPATRANLREAQSVLNADFKKKFHDSRVTTGLRITIACWCSKEPCENQFRTCKNQSSAKHNRSLPLTMMLSRSCTASGQTNKWLCTSALARTFPTRRFGPGKA